MVLKTATDQDKREFRMEIERLLRRMCARYKVTEEEIIIKIPKFVPIKK